MTLLKLPDKLLACTSRSDLQTFKVTEYGRGILASIDWQTQHRPEGYDDNPMVHQVQDELLMLFDVDE